MKAAAIFSIQPEQVTAYDSGNARYPSGKHGKNPLKIRTNPLWHTLCKDIMR